MTNTSFPLISIVVPIYNKQNYLEVCVTSLREQTYPDIEIILVNDGSIDESGAICDRFALQDSRIRVIHQANAGVSAARNAGLKDAKGEYVLFCDSDDFMDSTQIQELVAGVRFDADLCICGIVECCNGKQVPINLLGTKTAMCAQEDFWKAFREFHCHEFFGSNCNKLYRIDILKDYMIVFPDKISFAEDFTFNLAYFSKISFEKIFVVGKALYYYQQDTPGSLTKQWTLPLEQMLQDVLTTYEHYCNFYVAKKKETEYLRDMHYFLLYLLDWSFLRHSFRTLVEKKKEIIGICRLPVVQVAARDTNTYKPTIRVFRFAVRYQCYSLIYVIKLLRVFLGIH